MDLFVERQCVEQLRRGDLEKFFILYDEFFDHLFAYVARRLVQGPDVERVVKAVFFEAFAQIQNMPSDVPYLVWLYSLAKPRVWAIIDAQGAGVRRGLLESVAGDAQTFAEGSFNEEQIRAEKMFKKLSLEEGEILRLKFFEELADAEVLFVLADAEKEQGAKIYRVLKRAHFFLFGDKEPNQSVYFGDLNGVLARMRDLEKILPVPALKLNLRAEIIQKKERMSAAIDGEEIEAEFEIELEDILPKKEKATIGGSSDPAKIFVNAVKDLRAEEEAQRKEDLAEMERNERLFEIFEKVRPLVLWLAGLTFCSLVAYLGILFFWQEKPVSREVVFVEKCAGRTEYQGDFKPKEFLLKVISEVNNPICEIFKVRKLVVKRVAEQDLSLNVDIKEALVKYDFVLRKENWRIKSYEKIVNSDKKSR